MIRTIDTEHGKFTDLINDEGEVLKTAEEVYQEHLDNFDFINGEWIPKQIDICEPTDRERMEQIEGMVGMLAEQIAKQSLGM